MNRYLVFFFSEVGKMHFWKSAMKTEDGRAHQFKKISETKNAACVHLYTKRYLNAAVIEPRPCSTSFSRKQYLISR